jgi:hypothetical protein
MHINAPFVRSKYPGAIAVVRGGTGEYAALGKSAPAGFNNLERWVILSDSGPDGISLGEAQSMPDAWKVAAANIKTTQK